MFRLFRALLRPWENWENEEEGEKGEEERYELTSFDVSVYKFVGLYGLACIIIFFPGSTDYFTSGRGWRSWFVVIKKKFLRVRDDTMLFLRFNHTNGGQKNEAV